MWAEGRGDEDVEPSAVRFLFSKKILKNGKFNPAGQGKDFRIALQGQKFRFVQL